MIEAIATLIIITLAIYLLSRKKPKKDSGIIRYQLKHTH